MSRSEESSFAPFSKYLYPDAPQPGKFIVLVSQIICSAMGQGTWRIPNRADYLNKAKKHIMIV
jgi:hypothetical protein